MRFDDGMSTEVVPRSVTVELVAAFTKDGGGGNPAGVVLDATGLAPADRQRVAAEVGAPETAFVTLASDGAFETEFYSPKQQVPDCGHATVATFALLARRGALRGTSAVKRTVIGDRAITVEGERVFMEQPCPTFAPFPHAAEIAFALGLYVYAGDHAQFDATIRMFAPRLGILEEPATGMAAGLLGAYLARDHETASYRFLQGALMPQPSPSKLIVRVRRDRVLVGGTATPLNSIEIAL
jgi:predicted PhzF superfamily epimerase YddE/YHI9